METGRMALGKIGEDIAAAFLERRGVVVVDRNVRVGRDEIDLLVSVDGRRVAVEVKTARHEQDRPEENFDHLKEQRVRRAAGAVGATRVDLITVVLDASGARVRWLSDVG
ncbi:MAG: YraN family protein [Acidobacteria bacterium]|nr:YraN family protein [Acidobacteriota bacterium]